MPNMRYLTNFVAEQLAKPAEKFTSIDMQYVSGQIPLDRKTAEQCIFRIFAVKPSERIYLVGDWSDLPQGHQNSRKERINFQTGQRTLILSMTTS